MTTYIIIEQTPEGVIRKYKTNKRKSLQQMIRYQEKQYDQVLVIPEKDYPNVLRFKVKKK
jgi:hypothetical protein